MAQRDKYYKSPIFLNDINSIKQKSPRDFQRGHIKLDGNIYSFAGCEPQTTSCLSTDAN